MSQFLYILLKSDSYIPVQYFQLLNTKRTILIFTLILFSLIESSRRVFWSLEQEWNREMRTVMSVIWLDRRMDWCLMTSVIRFISCTAPSCSSYITDPQGRRLSTSYSGKSSSWLKELAEQILPLQGRAIALKYSNTPCEWLMASNVAAEDSLRQRRLSPMNFGREKTHLMIAYNPHWFHVRDDDIINSLVPHFIT